MRRVLSFPKATQEKVADGDLPYQLLVELDKSVLSKQREDLKSAPDPIIGDHSVAQIRDVFLKKYKDDIEKDVVDLRQVGTLFDTARSTGRVAERAKAALRTLVAEPNATIEDAFEVGAASSVEMSRVVRDMQSLPGKISDLLDGDYNSEQRGAVRNAIGTLQSELAKIFKAG